MARKYYVRLPATGSILETENPEIWPEGERVPAEKAKSELKQEARKQLRKWLKPGSVVYTVLRHCSASGMSRRIDLFIVRKNQPICISGYAAKVINHPLHKDGGIVAGGCGMDMGFHLVNNLSIGLFCPPGEYTHDGAYALKHQWM
jgi:hypothetical protein